jgi:ABC-type transporter Mla MlaB component
MAQSKSSRKTKTSKMPRAKVAARHRATRAAVTTTATIATAAAAVAVSKPAGAAKTAAARGNGASTAAASHVLRLGASLTIREVAECAAEFQTLLHGGPTNIDASALETIDTAGVQLLLAAAAAAQRRGFRLKLTGAMGLKTGAARSLGLGEHLSELAEIAP